MMGKRQTTFLLITAMTLSSVIFGLNVLHEEPDKLIRQGTLIFGDQNKRISNETEDDAAGTKIHQTDQPEASVGYQLAERKLRRLRPSVLCDEDSMTLRMKGRRVPRFLVERGEESPVPVSEMPAHCGFTVKRASGDAFLVSRYDACHMTQQGDSYILPLRVWDAPVKISCPVAAPFTILCSPSAMVIHLGASVDAVKLKVNGVWQPLLQASDSCGFTVEAKAPGWILTAPYTSICWQTEGTERLLSVQYMRRDLRLSCPLLQAPGNMTSPVHFPYLYGPPMPGFWPMHHKSHAVAPKPADPTATATTPKASFEEMWYPLPWYHGHLPASPKTTDSTTTVSTPKAASDEMWYPLLYHNSRPWSHYHGQIPLSPKSTTVAPKATDPVTIASTPEAGSDELYSLPYNYARPWPLYHGYVPVPAKDPTAAPETTDPTITPGPTLSTPKAGFGQLYPFLYGQAGPWPLYHGYVPVPAREPTATPETTDPTTTPGPAMSTPKAGFDQMYPFPYGQARPWPLYYGYVPVPTKDPTATPETTDPTTTSGPTMSTPKAGFDQMYPFPYGQARPWPLYYGYVPVPTKDPTATPETTDPTTTSTKTGADQPIWYMNDYGRLWHFYHTCLPAMNHTVAPKTLQSMFSVKPPSDQQLGHPFPWVPVVTDPLNPMHSQSLPDFHPGSDVRLMNQKPWMSHFRRRHRRLGRSVAGRLDQLCTWPMYYPAKAYNPPQQSSRDVWPYPFMANPVYDQTFVNQRWESVTQPVQLSPVQVTEGTTNEESALVSAQNDQTT